MKKMIEVISVNEACRILGEYGYSITPQKLRLGLTQCVYPFGDAIQFKQWDFDIYKHLLLKWIRERATSDEDEEMV